MEPRSVPELALRLRMRKALKPVLMLDLRHESRRQGPALPGCSPACQVGLACVLCCGLDGCGIAWAKFRPTCP